MLIFQYLNDKIHSYVLFDIIVNFIIPKLKNKHTFPKKYTNWAKLSSLIWQNERRQNRYFTPLHWFPSMTSCMYNWHFGRCFFINCLFIIPRQDSHSTFLFFPTPPTLSFSNPKGIYFTLKFVKLWSACIFFRYFHFWQECRHFSKENMQANHNLNGLYL